MGVKRLSFPGDLDPSGNFNTTSETLGGTTVAAVLTQNTDRWLDATNGSDSNDGTSAGSAWLTFEPFAKLLDQYASIDNCYARLTLVASEDTPTLLRLRIPFLGDAGKVVIRCTETRGMPASPDGEVIVTAAAGSTTSEIHVAAWPSTHNPIGWQLKCTAGANVGARRMCQDWTIIESPGDPTVLTLSAPLAAAGVGDTWAVVIPAAGFIWDDATIVHGAGTAGTVLENDPGLYISGLQVSGTPQFINVSLSTYGIDYVAPASGWYVGTNVLWSIGAVGFLGLPFLDPAAGNWQGYGLACRREVLSPSFGPLINNFDGSNVFGYAIGTEWVCDGIKAQGSLYGGRLWGRTTGSDPAVTAAEGASMIVGSPSAAKPIILGAPAAAAGVVYASGPGSVLTLRFAFFGDDETLPASDATILRATNGGLIQTDSVAGAPNGFSNAAGSDASGGGTITFDSAPQIFGGPDLKVTGLTGSAVMLATEQSALVDALGLSRIVRRATGAVTTSQQKSPALPPFNGSRVLTRITDGLLTTLLGAAPSGFLNVIQGVGVRNSGVAAGTPNIKLGSIRVDHYASIPAATDGGLGMSPIVTASSVQAQRVAGTSVSMDYRFGYCQIPQANLIPFLQQLTAAYAAISPSIIPPSGWTSRLWQGNAVLYGVGPQNNWIVVNNDSVSHTINVRITVNVSQQFMLQSSVIAAGSSGNAVNVYLPPIGPLDVVEVETAEAIVTPGTVVLYGVQEIVPQP